MEEADIEDVLGREFYLALVNRAFELPGSLQLSATKPVDAPDRVALEVKARFATMPSYIRDFDHFIPADFLFRSGDKGAELPGFQSALERMEKLIHDLNTILML